MIERPKFETKTYLYDNPEVKKIVKRLNKIKESGKLREDQIDDMALVHRNYGRKLLEIVKTQKEKMFRCERKINSGDTVLAKEIFDEVKKLDKEDNKLKLETVKKLLEIAERKIYTSDKIVLVGRNELCPLCFAKGVKIKWKRCREHNKPKYA